MIKTLSSHCRGQEGEGAIPGWRIKTLQTVEHSQRKEKEKSVFIKE